MAITTQFDPHLFRLVRMSELSRQHFNDHPIWPEYYDPDELAEIASWGVDPVWLNQQLADTNDGNDHWAYPILRPYPLPERMRLYIKARFSTAGGATLDGFIMNQDAFCITLFLPGDDLVFSRHPLFATEMARQTIALRHTLHRTDDPIFPMRYQTEFLARDNTPIAGTFS